MVATLDANALLRLTLRDVDEQYEIVRDLIAVPHARFRVTDMAIAEVVHALLHHYHFSRSQVTVVINAILSDPSFDTNRSLIGAVLEQFEHNARLSYMDCYLAEEARASGNTPLLTFDKDLAKIHPSTLLLAQVDGQGK